MKQVYQFEIKVGDKDYGIIIKKPSHSEVEDAEYVYAQKFNRLLNEGFLSKVMMDKKIGDVGGIYSEKIIKDLGVAIEKIRDCERVIKFFEGAEGLTDEEVQELKEAKDAYTSIRLNIANMDNDLEEMYSNSAERRAEQHMVKWLVLKLAHYTEKVKKEDGEVSETFPLFEGTTFEERLKNYSDFLDEVDDSDPEELSKKKKIVEHSIEKISRIVNLWYNGMGADEESLIENYELFYDEPLVEKPKEKPAKKKAQVKE